MKNWPFPDDEKNTAVLTLRSILQRKQPILYVSLADGEWQFLGSGTPTMEDAKIVALETVFELDPTVAELSDLPVDWEAWRESPKEPWQRAPCQVEE